MPNKLDWFGSQWKADFLARERKNVKAAAIFLSSQVKADISQPGTLRTTGQARTKKGRFKRGGNTIYNFTHSAPGNPPYKQTGRLRASQTWELAGPIQMIGRVGTNVKYGRWLELGTKKMAARPYLRAALQKWGPTLAKILTKQIQAGQLGRTTSNQFRSGILGAGARRAGF